MNELGFENIYVYTNNNETFEEYDNEYPESIWIETTNYCNAMVRKKGYMSLDLYKKIINELKFFKPMINLHYSGETFLHKDLYEIINYAKGFNLDVGFTTNGTLIDKDNYCILKTGIDRINISLAGVDKEDYEFIRKNSSFDEIEEKIIKLANLKKTNNFNTKIYINVTKTEKNKDRIENFVSKFNGVDGIDEVIVRNLMTWSKSVDVSGMKVNNNEEIDNSRNYEIVKISSLHPINFLLCKAMYKSLAVLWDGTVVPCWLDFQGYNSFGNLLEESFI
ncbi:radical SAM/SPASM domain-containing protein [Clostridium brassicae]|uniref:Radical SAM protein n=1 Tax=Clostridium brassicae TaxID=2999072 RepID=A0ABT4DEY4_9CLOT|nr:radical SAM protein [Clostridium brassicae]MCY6959569.1 radical SAM protein [Clostridium brassicae]